MKTIYNRSGRTFEIAVETEVKGKKVKTPKRLAGGKAIELEDKQANKLMKAYPRDLIDAKDVSVNSTDKDLALAAKDEEIKKLKAQLANKKENKASKEEKDKGDK